MTIRSADQNLAMAAMKSPIAASGAGVVMLLIQYLLGMWVNLFATLPKSEVLGGMALIAVISAWQEGARFVADGASGASFTMAIATAIALLCTDASPGTRRAASHRWMARHPDGSPGLREVFAGTPPEGRWRLPGARLLPGERAGFTHDLVFTRNLVRRTSMQTFASGFEWLKYE
jgi:hypothetical protein